MEGDGTHGTEFNKDTGSVRGSGDCFVIDLKSERVVDVGFSGHVLEKDARIARFYGFKCDSVSRNRFYSFNWT